jgi:hypothetical protein
MSTAIAMSHTVPFDFAQFLVDRDAITVAQAEAARQTADTERLPIGQLLLQGGALSVKQIMTVLAVQADHPTEKFGQIAVRHGFISMKQLEEALQTQALARRHLVEVISRMGVMRPEALLELTVAYVTLLELTLAAQ